MFTKEKADGFRLFYGWYILGSGFVILFFNSGARFLIGVVFKPLIEEFGWNRSTISLAFFLNMTVFALSLIVMGRLYDRYGPKWVITICTILLAVGSIGIAFIDTLWQFLIFYGVLLAIGFGGTSNALIGALTSKWFEKQRGLAVSLAISGNCLGQFLLVPLFTLLVLRYGWRASYFSIGLVMLVVNISLALLVIKGDPEDRGLRPLGYESMEQEKEKMDQSPSGIHSRDLKFGEAARTYSFWLFLIVMFICGSGDFLVATHLIPFVTDYNISPTTAGNMLALLGLVSLAGILVAGPVSDRIGNKIPIAITFMLRFFLFLLILKYQDLISFYIFALAFGFTFAITAPLSPILIGRLYGLSHLGVLSGFMSTAHHLGGGFWAYVGGVIFDQTGSYRLAFILSAAMALVAVMCTFFIKESDHRGRLLVNQQLFGNVQKC